MSKNTTMGLALLLVGIVAGAGAAQVLPTLEPDSFLNTGLFSVGQGEGVNFHVSLDDRRTGPPTTVLLRLLDRSGAVVARREATLNPGQSTTLVHREPGLYRAHAEVVEPDGALGARRIVLGTVEIFSFNLNDAGAMALVAASPISRFVCSTNDGGTNGRLPDQ
jgi:hypothetical protein